MAYKLLVSAYLLGLFLLMPNALILLALVLSFTSIQIQVRLEEEFLLEKHGRAYEEYCGLTPGYG